MNEQRESASLGPLFVGAAIAPWLSWVWEMRVVWSSAPEYYFGWAVPALTLYLAWLRWCDRPGPAGLSAWGQWVACGVFALGAAGLVFASILLEPNPLWTAAAWLACAGTLGMTVSAFYGYGGASWLRHFAWPCVFSLSSLAWPAWIQVPLLATLKSSNASVAADLVSALGYPAIAHGSAIELARGMVGVEDACSGIRSLQTAIMAALFLGELLRLPFARRGLLAVGSVATALAANLARTAFLAWCVAARGAASAEKIHDAAGLAEVILALACVFALALRLEVRPAKAPGRVGEKWIPAKSATAWALALVACACAAPLATSLWYSNSGDTRAGRFVWRLSPPDSSWRAQALSPLETSLLACDRVEFFRSGVPGDGEIVAAHLVWDRDPSGRYIAGLHRPDVCLPNAGARLVGDEGPYAVEVAGRTIVFGQLVFEAGDVPYQVFFTVWDSSRGGSIGVLENNAVDFGAERWRLVCERRRRLVMEQLTFAFGGVAGASEARSRLTMLLPSMLSRDPLR